MFIWLVRWVGIMWFWRLLVSCYMFRSLCCVVGKVKYVIYLVFLDQVFCVGFIRVFGFIVNKCMFIYFQSFESMFFNVFIEVIKGIYFVICLNLFNIIGGQGFGVNVDVVNNIYFIGQNMVQLVCYLVINLCFNVGFYKFDEFFQFVKFVQDKNGKWGMFVGFKVFCCLMNFCFRVIYCGKKDKNGNLIFFFIYRVKGVVFELKYGQEGVLVKKVIF